MLGVRVLLAWVAVAAVAAAEEDLAQENRRLKDEIAALKANDPDAVVRRAVDEYLHTFHQDEMPDQDATFGYQGGFTARSADGLYLLRTNVWGQFEWYSVNDEREASTRTQSRFQMKRMRVRFSGHAFTERLQYFVELELSPSARRFQQTVDTISEAYFIYRRRPWKRLRIKAGRFRPRFTSSEESMDEAQVFAERGLVNEYFTVGRTEGAAIVVENLRHGRMLVELALSNGMERFDPDQPVIFEDRRAAITFRWAYTAVGDGIPWRHTMYEGDPYMQPESVLVVGFGFHLAENEIAGTPLERFWQVAVDATWRRRGAYAAFNLFFRKNEASATDGLIQNDNDIGAQLTLSYFIRKRTMEVAVRAGWIDYARHVAASDDLFEFTMAWSFYWRDEAGMVQGHRAKATLDFGYAENIAVHSGVTNWPRFHGRGWQFRAQVTIFF